MDISEKILVLFIGMVIGFGFTSCWYSGLIKEAWKFVVDPESRVTSQFKYPNGNPMSVKEARDRGLM